MRVDMKLYYVGILEYLYYVNTYICKAVGIIYNFFFTKFDTEHLAIN